MSMSTPTPPHHDNINDTNTNVNTNINSNINDDDGRVLQSYNSHSSQILSRQTLLPYIEALDAGDVVECYTLTRHAKLATSTASSNSSSNNSGGPALMIQKSAIGFRFKPKYKSTTDNNDNNNDIDGNGNNGNGGYNTNTNNNNNKKEAFALTLEYGPQRTGATPIYESMPVTHGHVVNTGNTGGGTGGGSINGNKGSDGDGMYVSWENHAKIYYSLSIPESEWDNAYYMAPITGAVLTNILDEFIVDYPIHHPRYQPISIMEKDTGTIVLKSSNSDDFVWDVFQKLADMYVAIDPILKPRRYALQLYVDNFVNDLTLLGSSDRDDINVGTIGTRTIGDGSGNGDGGDGSESGTSNEDIRDRNVANAAGEFYEKLFLCVEAIKTGDYSRYEKQKDSSDSSDSSTTSNSPTSSPPIAAATTLEPTMKKEEEEEKGDGKGKGGESIEDGDEDEKEGEGNDNNDIDIENNETEAESEDEYEDEGDDDTRRINSRNTNRKRHGRRLEQDMFNIVQDELDKHDQEYESMGADGNSGTGTGNENEDSEGSNGAAGGSNNSNTLPYVDGANEAAQEAEKAAEQAKEAAVSHEDHKAAEAAGHAAEAAKKAAQATSDAASIAAMESLLSGDGMMMTNVISTCFSDPRYGIFQPDIVTATASGSGSGSGSEVDNAGGDASSNAKDTTATTNNNVDTEETSTTITGTSTAYVYLDGSNYYRVNLTSPFIRVEYIDQHLPIPNYLPNGKGDVIDIALAMSIIGGFLFGIIVMLHHIRVLDWDYRLQFKWFFHPRQERLKRGGYSSSPFQHVATPDDLSLDEETNGNGGVGGPSNDVEMAPSRRGRV